MKAAVGDDLAVRVLRESRSVALAAAVVAAWTAGRRTARTVTIWRALTQSAAALPRGERRTCAWLLIVTATGGHIVMASMLPPQARPMVWLTASALLVAILAASAAIARNR